MKTWSGRVGIVVFAGMVAASIGCGDADGGSYGPPSSPPAEAPSGDEGAGGRGAVEARCREGATHPCEGVIGVHGGIVNCFTGVTTCVGGRWSETCTPRPEGSPAVGAR